MTEFMNEQLTKSKRGRKPKATANTHLESDLTTTSSTTTTNRTEAELQAEAIRLHDIPRDRWPDDVLTYQREQQKLKKRKDRESLLDQLRRQVDEQQRRQEQLAKMAADEPEEQRHDVRPRANVREARTKRQRQSEVDAANAVPAA